MRSNKNLLITSKNPHLRRFASGNAGGGGGARLIGLALGAGAAGIAGVAGYAAYDPKFRHKIENSIPVSKELLTYTIGPEEPPAPKLIDLRPLQYSNDPKIAPKPFEPKKITNAVEKAPPEPIATIPTPPKKATIPKKELIGLKDPEPTPIMEVKKSTKNPYVGKEGSFDKNEALTESLKKLLVDAEKATKAATTAKLDTIRAIEHHIQTIREAIEGGKDGDWDAVTMAHLKAQTCEKKDKEAEMFARNRVADLVKEANFGKQGETTQMNPLLPVSQATAVKLSNELDEMATNVKKVDTERIFTNDYGKLVEESRKKFVQEVKAVHPEIQYEEGKKIKKNDLKTMLSHAHLRVDQLSMKLIDMKLKEEKRVKDAIEAKKKELLESLRIDALKKGDVKKEIVKIPEIDQKRFDEELAKKTKEIQEKFDRKLEDVVKTQKKLYDIEHANDVNSAVARERDAQAICIGKALSQLEGIEKALKGHLQMDIENRRSKQMWLATQNLVDTVKFGNRGSCCMEGRRAPLDGQMKTLMKCAGNDEMLKLVNDSMRRVSKIKGEYTCADLNTRFQKVYKIGRRLAFVSENTANGIFGHLSSCLKSALTLPMPIKKGDDKISPALENNVTLLDRAAHLWSEGKRLDAIRVLQLTTGATRRIARDFIEDARRHEETLFLARLLLAHSALTSIRSTY
ncbi:unnamed protein product [Caenorhabditis bovis]|uniref:MICOS complex subunit MIC60 n=1 Tax=Caenorhabditis bovis TaxID=2654633 RepID=A0A8S1EEZ4_9PELO|nr:unnamed protein product [Caenorhabditis bovis]